MPIPQPLEQPATLDPKVEAANTVVPRDLELTSLNNEALKKRFLSAINKKLLPTLKKGEVRKLLLELKGKSPDAYKEVKKLPLDQQRELFMAPILKAIGLGELADKLGPVGNTLLGVGLAAGGVGLGAIGGRLHQSFRIKKLRNELNKEKDKLLVLSQQRQAESEKLGTKIDYLETELNELNNTAESGANLLNLWVDVHGLI